MAKDKKPGLDSIKTIKDVKPLTKSGQSSIGGGTKKRPFGSGCGGINPQ